MKPGAFLVVRQLSLDAWHVVANTPIVQQDLDDYVVDRRPSNPPCHLRPV